MDSIDLTDIPRKVQRTVEEMLRNPKEMCSITLGEILDPNQLIQLIARLNLFYSQPYRAGSKIGEYEFAKFKAMLDAGVIEPATSEWASLVVFVPKHDGSLSFCVDYICLNALTVVDIYPLSRIDECHYSFG